MRENDAEIKKVDKVSDKFKPTRYTLPEINFEPFRIGTNSYASLVKKGEDICLVNSENNHDIRINKFSLKPNDFKRIKSGDTIILGNEIYIFNTDKKPELRFIKIDNNNNFLELFPSGVNNLNFYQGPVGDCFFLAALKSVSKNPNGAELIAKMIESIPDNKYKVTFPEYPKESFIVNPTDIKDSSSVSTDCLGVKILEHAFYMLKERLKWQEKSADNVNKSEWLKGGLPYEVLFILTGGEVYGKEAPFKKDGSCRQSFAEEHKYNQDIAQESIELLAQIKKNENDFVICAGTCRDFNVTKINGMEIDPNHTYSVSKIDPKNKKISIINPLDSSLERDIGYDDFFKYFCTLEFVELKDYQDPGAKK